MEIGCVSDVQTLILLKEMNAINVKIKSQLKLYIIIRNNLTIIMVIKLSSSREIGIVKDAIFSILLIEIHAKIAKSINDYTLYLYLYLYYYYYF
jgi:hypothetical protein